MSTIMKSAPQPGDIVVVPIPGQVGHLIELGQFLAGQKFKPYEHAEIYMGQADADGPYGYTYSAYPNQQGKQPLPCPPGEFPGALWSSGILPLTIAQRNLIVAWCNVHPAVGYSATDYFALAAARLHLNALLPPLRDYIQDSGHLICSQYCSLAWAYAKVPYLGTAWDGLITPMQIADVILAAM